MNKFFAIVSEIADWATMILLTAMMVAALALGCGFAILMAFITAGIPLPM